MKKIISRIMALALCLMMCLSALPIEALAAENGGISITDNAATTISVKQGQKVTMKVSARGKNLKYQWYYRKNRVSSWKKYSGKTNPTLTFKVGRNNGYQYRCKVWNSAGTKYSKVYKLNVKDQINYRARMYDCSNINGIKVSRNSRDKEYITSFIKKVKGPQKGKCDYSFAAFRSNYEKDDFETMYYWLHADYDFLYPKIDSNDVFLFYISSEVTADGELLFYKNSDYDPSYSYRETLSMNELAASLKTIPGKIIVFIEADYSGKAVLANTSSMALPNSDSQAEKINQAVISAFAAADKSVLENGGTAGNAGEFRDPKFYVLTSCGSGQKSSRMVVGDEFDDFFYNEKPNVGYFTYYLREAVNGSPMAADADRNGTITLGELYQYLANQLSGRQNVQVYPSASSTYPLFKKK